MKDPQQAIPYWLRYLEINPKDSHVMVRVADAYHKLHDTDNAIAFYEQALKVSTNDPFALLGLGNVYYAQHEDTRALLCFETLLKNNSQNVVVMTMTGNIYRRRKEFDQKALEIEPTNNFALFGMGDCYRGQQNMEKAVEWWDKILEREPENQALWTRVGDALLSLDRVDDAVMHPPMAARCFCR